MAAFEKPTKSKARPRGKPFVKGDKRAGRPPGLLNKATLEVREATRAMVDEPGYLAKLKARLDSGTLPPAIEAMLWYYAYGKPKERVEVTGQDGNALKFTLQLDSMERQERDA